MTLALLIMRMHPLEFGRCLYKHPIYAYKSNEARMFLGGDGEYFQLSEIEVYEKKSTLFCKWIFVFYFEN